jgi:TRAP-type C4-dicarboxylate transport system permease large subunit
MILFGWITGTSITACFLAPVVPGLILITARLVSFRFHQEGARPSPTVQE